MDNLAELKASATANGELDTLMAVRLLEKCAAEKVTAETEVKLTDLMVSFHGDGFLLRLEGYVPFAKVPPQGSQSPSETRLACLEAIKAAFPELIPEPYRNCTRL